MENLLELLATYLASHTGLTPGVSAFYNEMPDEPAVCLTVIEEQTGVNPPVQINAVTRNIKLIVRAANNTDAAILIHKCYRWLVTDDPLYDTNPDAVDPTGFIQIAQGAYIYVYLPSIPVWDKADKQGRRYFTVRFKATTQRI